MARLTHWGSGLLFIQGTQLQESSDKLSSLQLSGNNFICKIFMLDDKVR